MTSLSLLKDSLISSNFEVIICKEAKKALNAIKLFKPDLILLDLLMRFGEDLKFEILNNDQETHGIPIINISGFGNLVDIKNAYKLGAVGYLVKPFPLDNLPEK